MSQGDLLTPPQGGDHIAISMPRYRVVCRHLTAVTHGIWRVPPPLFSRVKTAVIHGKSELGGTARRRYARQADAAPAAIAQAPAAATSHGPAKGASITWRTARQPT